MTWVIGVNVSLLGYAAAISDVQVTFGPPHDRRRRDCLQKIYRVGPDIAAAFAGSVRIGFELINGLRHGLTLSDASLAWDPFMIAEQIPAQARRMFEECPPEEQAMGSQLMMIGANPASREGANGASTCVYSFSWPNFEPVRAQAHEVLSIGSGTGVAPYRQLLERYYSDPEWRVLLMHGESVPGGTASMLANSVTKVLQDNPQPGISAHLHLCVVRSGEVQIWTNDHSHKGRWQAFALGPPTINALPDTSDMERFSMPRVATTFSELNEMLSGNAALAVA